jgi:carbamoyltransferase
MLKGSFSPMADFSSIAAAVPSGSILGVNYSGMHDTSIAIVAPTGEPVFAVSLERISRVKQDGRSPQPLLENLPWDRIAKVALSVSASAPLIPAAPSRVHPLPFPQSREVHLAHGEDFYRVLALFQREVVHVPHHLSHASSAFWGSGLKDALCLVYDGGMSNEDCFGGLFHAAVGQGIVEVDRFSCALHANITHLYSAITAILGFRAQKHEGKITGLAAYGRIDDRCEAMLHQLLVESHELDGLFSWKHLYSESSVPELVAGKVKLAHLRRMLERFSREDIAATVQSMAEAHIVALLGRARHCGLDRPAVCLAGGLFANVKVNQRVAALGFEKFFVAPAMTDDGTALGAAWQVLGLEGDRNFQPRVPGMYLGPGTAPASSKARFTSLAIQCKTSRQPAKRLAGLLAQGAIVAVFQGASEFGPRALGNRSILAQASERSINDTLNQRLSRTEFMPFAPIVRLDDAVACFDLDDNVVPACGFMTVTVPCTERMRTECPGVVHVDGTARPQLVTPASNRLVHQILTHYAEATSRLALVNTSFNVHEEPIVCTLDDALRGFFEAGLDYLYVDGVGIVDRRENAVAENSFLRDKLAAAVAQRSAAPGSEPATAIPADAASTLFVGGMSLRPYLIEGFHAPEPWGAWSSGRFSRLVLPVDRGNRATVELHLTMTLTILDALAAAAPVVGIAVDGQDVGFVLFREHALRTQRLSMYVRTQADSCDIVFKLSHSGSPLALEQGSDQRELGFGLSGLSLAVAPAGDPAAAQASPPHIWGG